MKCSKTWQRVIFLWVLAAVFPLERIGAADAPVKVKVHKELIRLQVGESGQVQVIGSAGAIEATAAVRAYLRREDTEEKQTFDVAADGSFQAAISAPAGDKLRVYAQAGDKTSYGTFTVPAVSSQTSAPQPPSLASLPAVNATPPAQLSVPEVVVTPEPALEDIEALGLDPVKLRRELIKAHQENIRLRRELQRVRQQLQQLQNSIARLLEDSSSVTSAVATPGDVSSSAEK